MIDDFLLFGRVKKYLIHNSYIQEAAEKLAVEKELLESDTSMLAEEKEKLLKEATQEEDIFSSPVRHTFDACM